MDKNWTNQQLSYKIVVAKIAQEGCNKEWSMVDENHTKTSCSQDQSDSSNGMHHDQIYYILDIEPICVQYDHLSDLDCHIHEKDIHHEKVVVIDDDSCERRQNDVKLVDYEV